MFPRKGIQKFPNRQQSLLRIRAKFLGFEANLALLGFPGKQALHRKLGKKKLSVRMQLIPGWERKPPDEKFWKPSRNCKNPLKISPKTPEIKLAVLQKIPPPHPSPHSQDAISALNDQKKKFHYKLLRLARSIQNLWIPEHCTWIESTWLCFDWVFNS